jgi:transporter family protein
MAWWVFASISALAAAATSIFAKVGMVDVPSNLATAVRVVVVVVFAWAIAAGTGETAALRDLKPRTLLFLALSGLGTGVSWLAYFKALKMAPASQVAPIDKLSIAFTLILAVLFLKETLTWKIALGTALVVAGALLTTMK